ncbi:unnamed protein product [Schistosoma margrebowiei]|uniref:Uncharacterized protein n=1 Tax=Schistosoma margrebowiei TaxID=48269 RepID=A0A183MAB9_9TREM|nr:unnamed protein product [Schistosoma margrebowiei]
MSGNTSQSQCIRESLDSFFRCILSAKLDDQKVLLNSVPLTGKLVFGDSKITYSEALYLFCRLERDYVSLDIFPNRSLFSRKEDCLESYNSLRAGFDSVFNNSTLSNNELYFSVYMQILTGSRGQLISLYPFYIFKNLSGSANSSLLHTNKRSYCLRNSVPLNYFF